MLYDSKNTNPPACFLSDQLALLYQALLAYDGTDCYAHPYRKTDAPQSVEACVLVVITNEVNPRLLLTKRSHRLNAHAGEISFVGGRRDRTDVNTADTALREAHEEVGLERTRVNVIGYLPCQTAKSGILVRPVVAVVDGAAADELFGSELEIERIFWADFLELLRVPPSDIVLHYEQAAPFITPAWHVDGEIVWGLTGRIIANLLEIGFGIKHEWYYRTIQED